MLQQSSSTHQTSCAAPLTCCAEPIPIPNPSHPIPSPPLPSLARLSPALAAALAQPACLRAISLRSCCLPGCPPSSAANRQGDRSRTSPKRAVIALPELALCAVAVPPRPTPKSPATVAGLNCFFPGFPALFILPSLLRGCGGLPFAGCIPVLLFALLRPRSGRSAELELNLPQQLCSPTPTARTQPRFAPAHLARLR